MTRFRKKYAYSVKLGYKRRPADRNFIEMNFSVVVGTRTIEAAIEKATAVMMNWPGANCQIVEVYSASNDLECY